MDFNNLERTWIIAEIGVNHEGDAELAASMIRQASDAGADAVKFQTFRAEHYVSSVQMERRDRARGFELTHDEFRKLADVAKECGVVFFSTPLHDDDIDFLKDVAPLIKISSGDLTHLALIRHAARTGNPMIISTGLGTRDEIAAAVAAVEDERPSIRDEGGLLLMHCIAAYPTPENETHLRNIGWLEEEFGLPVGYSDHTLGTKACELAVAVGAVALEKHFTYRKEDQDFHDHHISADPKDMTQLVEVVRRAETYLGSFERTRGESEVKLLDHMRRSVGTTRDMKAGETITAADLTYLRPAWGLGPESFDGLLGKTLTRDVPDGDLLKAEDVK